MSVALLDGRSVDLHLDSASISAEVCRALADKINLQDTYGFSLYISLFDKVGVAPLTSSVPAHIDILHPVVSQLQRIETSRLGILNLEPRS